MLYIASIEAGTAYLGTVTILGRGFVTERLRNGEAGQAYLGKGREHRAREHW